METNVQKLHATLTCSPHHDIIPRIRELQKTTVSGQATGAPLAAGTAGKPDLEGATQALRHQEALGQSC